MCRARVSVATVPVGPALATRPRSRSSNTQCTCSLSSICSDACVRSPLNSPSRGPLRGRCGRYLALRARAGVPAWPRRACCGHAPVLGATRACRRGAWGPAAPSSEAGARVVYCSSHRAGARTGERVQEDEGSDGTRLKRHAALTRAAAS